LDRRGVFSFREDFDKIINTEDFKEKNSYTLIPYYQRTEEEEAGYVAL